MKKPRKLKELFFFDRKEVTRNLRRYRKRIDNHENDIVFVCIGTDRSTGDCLGPLVGTRLKELGFENVYGTVQDPIHALNMKNRIEEIKECHPGGLVIAIDASVGEDSSLEWVRIKTEPLEPGIGVGRDLPTFGDISITGITCSNEGMGNMLMRLNNVRLVVVFRVANKIIDTCLYLRKTVLSEEAAVAKEKKKRG